MRKDLMIPNTPKNRNPEPGYHRYLIGDPPDPKDEQNKRVLEVIDEIRELFLTKNDAYYISPVEILPVETWLHQIRIKAERALQAKDPKKRDEELRDCTVYCLLVLGKIRRKEKV